MLKFGDRLPDYCPCAEEGPDPCSACGATISGNDHVNGVCQARHNRPAPQPLVQIVLIDKRSDEIVASTR